MTTQTLVSADRVIDGSGRPPLRDAGVLLEDDRIVAVGPLTDLRVDADADVSHHPGSTIVPGLIDMHAHVSFMMTSPRTPYAEIADPAETVAVRAVAYMERKLRAGVTTARVLSERNHIGAVLRDAESAGDILAPRLVVAGLGIKTSELWGHTATYCGDTPAMLQLIADNLDHGSAVTKIFLTANQAPDGSGTIDALMTREQLAAVIDASHKAGIQVSAHCLGGPGLRDFIELGGDTVEHGFFASADDLAAMRRRGTWLVATIGYLFDRFDMTGDPDSLAARDAVGATYRAARREGVRVVLGTDDGVEGLGHEMACMVAAGYTPMEAIVAGTSLAAQCLGRNDIGRLEPGRLADLVVVAGDPLEDILSMQEISHIRKAGRYVMPAPVGVPPQPPRKGKDQ